VWEGNKMLLKIDLGDKKIIIPKKFDLDEKYRLEKDLNKEVKKLFKLFAPELQATRKEQGRYCSCAGVHDYLLCYKGMAGSVELKSEKGEPSDLQLRWGREAEAAGRIIGYAWTLGDVLEVIRKLEMKYRKIVIS
jgi:hypothetical protein